MRRALSIVCLLLATNAVSAQDVTARSFLPRDYTFELRADMVGLVDSGIWDVVERSMIRLALVAFREEYGFDIADLDRVRFAQRVDPQPGRRTDLPPRYVQVWILEGSDRVGTERLPEEVRERSGATTAGGVTVFELPYGAEVASPAPGLFVHARTIGMSYASDDEEPQPGLVTRTLRGERRGGAPVPELVPLTASPHALVVLAGVSTEEMPLSAETMPPFPAGWFHPDSAPIGVRIQLVRRPGTGTFALELLVRFESEAGALHMARGFDDSRAVLAEDPETRGFAKILEPVRKETDGSDLTFVLELGTERQAVARLSQLFATAVPLLWLSAGDAQQVQIAVQAVEAGPVEVEAEEPPEPEPPAEGEKKKKKNP